MLRVQIAIMEQYLDHHRVSNVRFHERKWGTVAVGGAGRASAEVARDLSLFYPGTLATRAVDHRRRLSDVFETEGGAAIKPAFANFIKVFLCSISFDLPLRKSVFSCSASNLTSTFIFHFHVLSRSR
jgi:hypothetical protein